MVDDKIERDGIDEPEDGQAVDAPDAPSGKRADSKGFVFGAMIVASLIGGAIGIGGAKYLAEPDQLPSLRQDVKNDLAKLDARIATLQDTVNKLAKEAQHTQGRMGANEKKITDLSDSLDGQAENLNTLEAAAETLVDVNKRLVILEALAGENTDLVSGANSIETRLKALEEAPAPTLDAEILGGLSTEIEALKTQVETMQTSTSKMPMALAKPEKQNIPITLPKDDSANSAQKALRILIDTYPRKKMLAAVRTQERLARKKPGWLERVLRKHIQLRKEEQADPYILINSAENKLKDGDITGALDRISKLNPPVRTVASEWIQAAKIAQKRQFE